MTGVCRRAALAALGPVLVLVLVLVLGGCATGTDDELEPRETPTVTVTADPVQELPARLDLQQGADLSEEVVWSAGTRLHVGGRTVDLPTPVPEQMVVLPAGLLVRAGTEVWFLAGRSAEGLALPPVTSLALSSDGRQVVLGLADRDEPAAYSLDGRLLGEEEVQPVRSGERTRTGPGDRAAPDDVAVRGWLSGTEAYGVRGREVVRCDVAGASPRCEAVDTLPRGVTGRDVVFGDHPAG